MEKKYLYALMEECLQSMDSGCDLRSWRGGEGEEA